MSGRIIICQNFKWNVLRQRKSGIKFVLFDAAFKICHPLDFTSCSLFSVKFVKQYFHFVLHESFEPESYMNVTADSLFTSLCFLFSWSLFLFYLPNLFSEWIPLKEGFFGMIHYVFIGLYLHLWFCFLFVFVEFIISNNFWNVNKKLNNFWLVLFITDLILIIY